MRIKLAGVTMPAHVLGFVNAEPPWMAGGVPALRFPQNHPDGEGDGGAGGGGDTDDDDGNDNDGDEPDDDTDSNGGGEDVSGLKRALRAARKEAREAQRALKAAQRKGGDDSNEGDTANQANARVESLEREIWTRDAADELRDRAEEGSPIKKASKAELRRYVKMLDSIAPDDLADAIDALEEEAGHLFEKQHTAASHARQPSTARRRAADSEDDADSSKGGLSKTSRRMLEAQGYIPRTRRG